MAVISQTFVLILVCCLISIALGDVNQTKALCFSGSNLYQRITQNCNDQDSSYTGTWYCTKIEVCEPYINSNRVCITTRGCAKEAECTTAASTSGFYDETLVQPTTGVDPGGMEIKLSCCQAENFPNDDAVAITYSDICNDASSVGWRFPASRSALRFLLSPGAVLCVLSTSALLLLSPSFLS